MARYKKEDKTHFESISLINSLVGEGAEFKGEFRFRGTLRIDGTFRGLVETQGRVLVGEKGYADADIITDRIIVGGKVRGSIKASEFIEILSTAEVNANVVAPKVTIEEGVSFCGNCIISSNIPDPEIEAEVLSSDYNNPYPGFAEKIYKEKAKNAKVLFPTSDTKEGASTIEAQDEKSEEIIIGKQVRKLKVDKI